LWLGEVPRDQPEIRSAFFADKPSDFPDLWLEIRKKRRPALPAVPEKLQDWVPQKFQSNPEEYLDKGTDELIGLLKRRITVLVGGGAERIPEEKRLDDYRGLEDAWREYLVGRWEPYKEEMLRWRPVQDVYERVDFMRRRLEEEEERYELLLAVGLLQWRDSTGRPIKRHLLTAPADISLDSARGVLTVRPADFFQSFRVELDMLERREWPLLEKAGLEDRLEELDVAAWDTAKVAGILRVIANMTRSDAEVIEGAWVPLERADNTFRVLYAPALVLRERRPTAYDELITRFLQASSERGFSATAPWDRFVCEGEAPDDPGGEGPGGNFGETLANHRLYFPRPTNEEQRRIVECLMQRPYVLVKGPPGTGKSHTIANLICHLLATGERVLVTAHAPKALTVLRGLLPGDIGNLCVTALGSSREDHRLLEDSVRGILSRKHNWDGQAKEKEISRLEEEISNLERRIVEVDRQLRDCREAEIYPYKLDGNYEGTAAKIARQVEEEGRKYESWFPELADDQRHCPLEPDDIKFLAEVHAALTDERLSELRQGIGTFSLPDPGKFTEAIDRLNNAETSAKEAHAKLREEQLPFVQFLKQFSDASLDVCMVFLNELEERTTRAGRMLGDLAAEILKDFLAGELGRWDRLEREIIELLEKIREAHMRAGAAEIKIAVDVPNARLVGDVRRRLEHLSSCRWRGWGWLAPRAMRETRYVEECCRVNGVAPCRQELLEILLGYVELRGQLERFYVVWPATSIPRHEDPRQAASGLYEVVVQFRELLEWCRKWGQDALNVVPIHIRETLTQHPDRAAWRGLIEAERARRLAHSAKEPLEGWLRTIRGDAAANQHPCMEELAKAIENRDPARWRNAWEKRESLRRDKDRLRHYEELLGQLQVACPELASSIRSMQGDPEGTDRVRQLRAAWDWAAARAWVRKATDRGKHAQLDAERHRLTRRLEEKLGELATLRAWQGFFRRLDDRTEQRLVAWAKTVARIGKGTGKNANRHRRTARRYLMDCIPKIPAWIMPLHKLWETTDPTPGIFDTVIVDEASQAGIEALALFLLAKRIVVVGDDKQNSPEAVGIDEDDVARLVRDHLLDFVFRDEFRPDTSLYDHAYRAFGNVISLREHFRCVPEIIRFSNDLCYTDAPLIPLRQAPPKRLPPLKAEFVEQGVCQGDGPRICNHAEAEAIVDAIRRCLDDEAYEGKTMGVIVLQGHAQVELIEKRLGELLEPEVRVEKKLRCGVPATFQGDERDVIFLSLVIAPNRHFRALTEPEALRRFNVAMSRARDQVWVFHSVKLEDLSREDLRWRLLNFFRGPGQDGALYEELDRLERAAKGKRDRGNQPDPYESWFEVDVALELLRKKYRVRPQVEVGSYRIDLVVEGLQHRLAVECDGDAWHGPERYEQDMARQRQLERANWTFVRIRESEFYADRERAVRRICEACEQLGILAGGEEEGEVHEEAEEDAQVGISGTRARPPQDREHRRRPEPDEALETEEDDLTLSPPREYLGTPGLPDPRDAPLSTVEAALRRIIEKEGPLTKRFLFRIYIECCPALRRAGKSVKSILNRALYSMQKTGDVIVEDELGDRLLESQVVRLAKQPRVRERPAGRRDLLDIPPSELLIVIDRMWPSLTTSMVRDDDELARALLEHYGFKRLTQGRRKHIMRILAVYRRRKRES